MVKFGKIYCCLSTFLLCLHSLKETGVILQTPFSMCVKREKKTELENYNNSNVQIGCLLFTRRCSKPFTDASVNHMKLPVFGCSCPMKTAISWDSTYISSFHL